MDELTKPPRSKRPAKFSVKETGQISIFLGMSILVVITFIAFVVNVGLFVKAKINLQNAVDASAYAGASVQARQLTNMGYLNWELRNTYKEWLFKYYIFGNIGLDAIEDIDGNEPNAPAACGGNQPLNPGGPDNGMMNFRLRQFKGSNCQYHDPNIFDRYNVPSVCIHFGSNNNICEIVTLPGLPRFNTVGLPSISEQHQTFLNQIVQTKSDDCSDRSNVNMGAAMLWTYGTGTQDLFPGIPSIAAGRVGAWVESLELALRMRNLEFIMNTPPEDFVCLNPKRDACKRIDEFGQGLSVPMHERIVKAYYSGYRNLSGGASKDAGNDLDLGTNYRMREIPPTPLDVNENSLSGFLIPGANTQALNKHYIDLQIMPVNYSIFYTSFFPSTGAFKATDPNAPPAEGKCGGTKTALPVPGYIQGFVKNPEVMTYYAVEGKSEFVGLFYPFVDQEGITLSTYAAAKPFGGRIGPAIYRVSGDQLQIRNSGETPLSANYISAFNTGPLTALAPSELITGGYPVPVKATPPFWTSQTSNVVGGNPVTTTPTFGVPNLIYDFVNYSEIASLGFAGGSDFNSLNAAANETAAYAQVGLEAGYGLYRKSQFRLFQANKVGGSGAVFSNAEIMQSILNVRRATRYEALNYLVPIMDLTGNNDLGIDQNSYIHPASVPGSQQQALDPNSFQYEIYAPLFGPNTLYIEISAVQNIVDGYINQNNGAVEAFTGALRDLANEMRNQTTDVGLYTSAADSIYPPASSPLIVNAPDGPPCENLSMASKFAMFFTTGASGCGITPLGEKVTQYFRDDLPGINPRAPSYYLAPYKPPTFDRRLLLTGYQPGPRQGADNDGNIGSTYTSTQSLAKRNSYSTKFFPIRSVLDSTKIGSSGLPIFGEGNDGTIYPGLGLFATGSTTMRNSISQSELSDYGADPKF